MCINIIYIKDIHKTHLVVNVFQDRHLWFDHNPYHGKMTAGMISNVHSASGHAGRGLWCEMTRGFHLSRKYGKQEGWNV